MMVVIDVKVEVYDAVNEVLGGEYRTFEQFVDVALRNQLALEGTRDSREAFVVPSRDEPSRKVAPLTKPSADHERGEDEEWKALVRRISEQDVQAEATPVLVRTDGLLWGQVNRLLPTAAGIRVLGNLLIHNSATTLTVGDWHRKATQVAIRWGAELGRLDKHAGRKRGELWATAFPTSDSASSRRYASQFLGTPGSQGPLGGADLLGLITFSGSDDDPRVGLTQAGAQWASLENPIFDTAHPKSTFSVLETRFFLEHLERHLPDEYEFLQLVSELIDRGLDRTALDVALEKAYPMWAGYVETMRAGAIGRLHDLGLLRRVRKGQRVEYALTDLAYDLGKLVTRE
jgi:hypothetical protein